jgi:hypothetical protein
MVSWLASSPAEYSPPTAEARVRSLAEKFLYRAVLVYHTVKKVHEFPVSSRDVTNQTPPGQE